MKTFLPVFIFLFVTLNASGRVDDTHLAQLRENLVRFTTQPECTNKIWPGMDWSQKNFIFVDHANKKAQLFNLGKNALENKNYDDYSNVSWWDVVENNEGHYDIVLEAGNIETPQWINYFAFHEGFHFLQQVSGKWLANTARGAAYPIDLTPRYLRSMMYNRLIDFLKSNDQTDLGMAKFWYSQWKNNYPLDFNASKDSTEGTAEYFYYMSVVFEKYGCSLTDSQYLQVIRGQTKLFPRFDGKIDLKSERPLDTEYYKIGALATTLLRFSNNKTWQKDISEKEKHILDVLFAHVAESIDAEVQPDILANFRKSELEYKKFLSPLIDPKVQALEKNSSIRLLTEHRSISPKFFGYLNSDLSFTVINDATSWSSENYELALSENEILFTKIKSQFPANSHCDSISTYKEFVLIPRDSIAAKTAKDQNGKQTFTVNSKTIQGTISGWEEIASDGATYICN